MTQDTRLVHCYDLASFVTAIEQAVKDGYNLDLKTVEHYPQMIGYQFITTMVKQQDSSLEQEVQEVKQEVAKAEEVSEPEAPAPVVETKKPGRPTKSK